MKIPICWVSQSKSSSFYKTRRESYVRILLEYFEEKQGSDIEQNAVMELLNLNSFQKVQATNAVKQAFPIDRQLAEKGLEVKEWHFIETLLTNLYFSLGENPFQHP